MASKKVVNVGYVLSLAGPDLLQYRRLIDLCEGIDPYELELKDFIDDILLVPDINIVHISHYLVHKTRALSINQMKSFKGTEAHNFLTSGFVLGVGFKKLASGNVLCLGKVKHSQTLSVGVKPLLPWVIVLPCGDILTAWCTCVAGRSESCSHVGAVLYALELAARKKDAISCTSRPNAWLPPAMREVPACEVRHIDFVSSHRKRRQLLDHDTDVDTPQDITSLVTSLPSKEELDSFLKDLHDSDASCALFRVLPEFKDEFAVKDPEGLPLKLSDLFDPKLFGLSREELKKEAARLFNICNISLEQRTLIEKVTRPQSKSHVWNLLRAGRVSGSTIYDALHTSLENPSITVVMKICYPFRRAFVSYWMERGLRHEPMILDKYLSHQDNHLDLEYRKCGFFIPLEAPHSGASPDLLVRCKCCGGGLAEFKSLKSRPSPGFVDPKHMFQMQHQMFCVGTAKYCDYVVYVGDDHGKGTLDVTRVYPDKDFQEKIVADSEIFFREVVLLELLARYFSSLQTRKAALAPSNSTNGTAVDLVCHCRKPRQDPMVKCVGRNCYFQYYHVRCVQLTQARQNWLCSMCVAL